MRPCVLSATSVERIAHRATWTLSIPRIVRVVPNEMRRVTQSLVVDPYEQTKKTCSRILRNDEVTGMTVGVEAIN